MIWTSSSAMTIFCMISNNPFFLPLSVGQSLLNEPKAESLAAETRPRAFSQPCNEQVRRNKRAEQGSLV